MGQLNFYKNFNHIPPQLVTASQGSLSFFPFQPEESISLKTLNIPYCNANAVTGTASISIGIYSITGSTLSIANSLSGIYANTDASFRGAYVSMTNTSAAQNITPGTWFLGLLQSTTGMNNARAFGVRNINPGNAFPGGFIGGEMTDSTNALPSSISTSDLGITGQNAMMVPCIIISA